MLGKKETVVAELNIIKFGDSRIVEYHFLVLSTYALICLVQQIEIRLDFLGSLLLVAILLPRIAQKGTTRYYVKRTGGPSHLRSSDAT